MLAMPVRERGTGGSMGGSGGFFGALFGGKDVNLNNLIGQYGQIGGQQTGTGQKYENQAGDFFSSILSGDAGRISQALAPEISAAKTSQPTDTEI